jgi:hypothetical protein
MMSGGVSPIGSPRHETGFEPAPGQRKPKLRDRPAEALRSCHYNHRPDLVLFVQLLERSALSGISWPGAYPDPMPDIAPYTETR